LWQQPNNAPSFWRVSQENKGAKTIIFIIISKLCLIQFLREQKKRAARKEATTISGRRFAYHLTPHTSRFWPQLTLFTLLFFGFSGINQIITYSLKTDGKNTSEYFHIDTNEGIVYLKKSLDHETLNAHHFTVMATDKGVPSLSSTAHVWVTGAYLCDIRLFNSQLQ
jgi:Cadherin domain